MTSPGAPDAPVRRWPRWMGLALVASLACNLLVVGTLAAAAWRHHRHGPLPHQRMQATVLDFATTLPPERRRVLREATQNERVAVRPFRAELRQARAAAREALLAQPFDAERFKLAQERLLSSETRARTAAQGLFHAVVLKLSPDERIGFANFQKAAERPWRQRSGQPGEAIEETEPMPADKSAAPGGTGTPPKQ